MDPPKKTPTLRGRTIRIAPDPPNLQDVLDEIGELKTTLYAIQHDLAELKRKVADLPDEIERS